MATVGVFLGAMVSTLLMLGSSIQIWAESAPTKGEEDLTRAVGKLSEDEASMMIANQKGWRRVLPGAKNRMLRRARTRVVESLFEDEKRAIKKSNLLGIGWSVVFLATALNALILWLDVMGLLDLSEVFRPLLAR